MTDTVTVPETSEIHRNVAQLCYRIHPTSLLVLFPVQFFCKSHHVIERCVSLYCDVNAVVLFHVRANPQGVWYRDVFSGVTTISVFQKILRIRG